MSLLWASDFMNVYMKCWVSIYDSPVSMHTYHRDICHRSGKHCSLKLAGNVWRHNADEQMLLKEKHHIVKHIKYAWATCTCNIRTHGSEWEKRKKNWQYNPCESCILFQSPEYVYPICLKIKKKTKKRTRVSSTGVMLYRCKSSIYCKIS